MKTFTELRSNLTSYKKMKKELEKQLENKELFNRRAIFLRIRMLEFKIWKTQRKLKEFA